jgi:hypothetical protein
MTDHEALLAIQEQLDGVEWDSETVVTIAAIEENYVNNTLGARLITTLLHQYFIHGGLPKPEVKKTSFQKTLSLKEEKAA